MYVRTLIFLHLRENALLHHDIGRTTLRYHDDLAVRYPQPSIQKLALHLYSESNERPYGAAYFAKRSGLGCNVYPKETTVIYKMHWRVEPGI